MQEISYEPIRILSIDGSDIYRAMHRVDGTSGLTVKDKNGKLDTRRFRGFLDASLDTDRIKKAYAKHGELPGSFRVCKEYTTAVVNVSFDFSVKEFYNKGKCFFVRDGYDVKWDMLEDHVCIIREEGAEKLIAIEVLNPKSKVDKYAPVLNPISENLLEGLFVYDDEKKAYYVNYRKNADSTQSSENFFPTKKTRSKVRASLYKNGFDIDGVHYVRYKRSAGSSREGHCLFIAEPLYEDMMEWSSCGLDSESVCDQASWQAYISLTLSSIEKKIHIPRQSIMIIKDQYSSFKDTVVRVSELDEGLVASKEEVDIKNAIWDGEALLDSSVFNENGYADKGMMLLRNRFFKTCAFNTNLQEWFADNGITKPSQLSGYRSAKTKSIKDIKLVITESSLKYLKFKPSDVSLGDWFEKWLDNIFVDKETSLFGVVKTDKATGPMGNKMVKTNYQLLNTLELSADDTDVLLEQSLDFLHEMQWDPTYVRYHTNLYVSDTYDEEDSSTAENYRQRLTSDLSRRSDEFAGTVFYCNYRSELCQNFKKRLKHGRILIDGGYHTLLGNGMEFLHAVIDKSYEVDKPLFLGDGEIYAPKFADGEMLLCERSPHITMGNLFVAKNKYVTEIDKYFNLGAARSVVCVNAVRSNLQQRLNGCDYDSDAMLITNNSVLRDVAIKNYDKFLVPYCDVLPGGSVSYTTSPEDLSELDVKISENKIGEIVNLSQFLNSLYWDKLSRGETEGLEALYSDICKLAVLSGMEIDKAKRLFRVSADAVLNELRSHKETYKKQNGGKIPEFFAFMTESDAHDSASKNANMNTPMSFVYDAVKNDKRRAPKSKMIYYTDLFELQFEKGDPTGAYSKRRDSILKTVEEAQLQIKHLNFVSKKKNRSERILAMEEIDSLFEECKEKVEKTADDHVYYLLLHELDKREETDKSLASFHSLLFAVMCYANDGYLLRKLKNPRYEMFDLIPHEDAIETNDETEKVSVYGYPHVKGRRRK